MTSAPNPYHVPPHVCSVCRQPITYLSTENKDGTGNTSLGWTHFGGADHEPDPIPFAETIDIRPRCDFCNKQTAGDGWVYPADHVTIHPAGNDKGNLQYDDRGWYACPRCAPLIENGRIDLLAARCATAMETGRPDRNRDYNATVTQFTELFEMFMDKRNGDRIPYSEYQPPLG